LKSQINENSDDQLECPANSTPAARKEIGITGQTYYRSHKECGGLKVDQARWLKELEQENAKLKQLVAELSLDKHILSGRIFLLPRPNFGSPIY
jgi:hypothetical protein